ncbi:hypothetical protein SAMN06272765_1463 [Streptomyces sp. Ag109_G2-15]|nr:hypothetical protein SAMN06272765_1463 [Streptomyces sp. Ag109_G2-15]
MPEPLGEQGTSAIGPCLDLLGSQSLSSYVLHEGTKTGPSRFRYGGELVTDFGGHANHDVGHAMSIRSVYVECYSSAGVGSAPFRAADLHRFPTVGTGRSEALPRHRWQGGRAPQLLVTECGQLSVRGNETSTRRFFFRPASVELSAIGYCSP